MKKVLIYLVIPVALMLGSAGILRAQTLSITATELDEIEHYIIIGATDKGYYAMHIRESKLLYEKYRDFNYFTLSFFDNTNKLVKTWDSHEITSPLTSDDAMVLEAFVLNNELTFLCYDPKSPEPIRLVQPFKNVVKPVQGFKPRGGKANDFNTVDVAVAPGGKQVFIYENPDRFTNMGVFASVVYDENLEKVPFNVSLKVPMSDNREVESKFRYIGKYIVAQYDMYHVESGAYSIHFSIVNSGDGTMKNIDIPFNDFKAVEVTTAGDEKSGKLHVFALYRTRHEGEESYFSGNIHKVIDMATGTIEKDTKHDYTPEEKKITALIEYGLSDYSESASFLLPNGDIATLYREGKLSSSTKGYENNWNNMYVISHDQSGKVKWVKDTGHTVEMSDRFDENYVAIVLPEHFVLVLDEEEAPAIHKFTLDGTTEKKLLHSLGTINAETRVVTGEACLVSPNDLLLPCLHDESMEILRIKF